MKTLVVIGAGFSGAVTAAQFLRRSPPGVRVVLINRSGAMARGLAYGTNSSLHLLNVPAGNMSAYVDEPDHFLRFCQAQDAAYTASSFVPRKLYGDYLASVLDFSEAHCSENVRLERLISEVYRITPSGAGAVLELENGEQLKADQVVLAFGNFSPLDIPGFACLINSPYYQSDPWSFSLKERADMDDRSILLIGSGLTALDVALGLLQQGHRGPIHMVSRRGLHPLPHRPQRHVQQMSLILVEKLLKVMPTVRAYMREIRSEIEAGRREGLDWRDLLAALRSYTPSLWARLPSTERRRFLRHVQPYWDVHRHRVAPEAYLRFQEALASGQINPVAGRIKSIDSSADGLRIGIQLRGGQQIEQIDVARVINCTGPNTNLRCVDSPLINQLRKDGLVQLDPFGLGLCVDARLSVKNAKGISSSWLYYVGPMLKADYWEATAVPELRQHAKSLACELAKNIQYQMSLV
ncbi:FAD/NAD(P)-binding protein [Pseudomonas chlororaphis]